MNQKTQIVVCLAMEVAMETAKMVVRELVNIHVQMLLPQDLNINALKRE